MSLAELFATGYHAIVYDHTRTVQDRANMAFRLAGSFTQRWTNVLLSSQADDVIKLHALSEWENMIGVMLAESARPEFPPDLNIEVAFFALDLQAICNGPIGQALGITCHTTS